MLAAPAAGWWRWVAVVVGHGGGSRWWWWPRHSTEPAQAALVMAPRSLVAQVEKLRQEQLELPGPLVRRVVCLQNTGSRAAAEGRLS